MCIRDSLNPAARYLVREINMNEDGSLTNVHEQVLGGDFLMDALSLIHI